MGPAGPSSDTILKIVKKYFVIQTRNRRSVSRPVFLKSSYSAWLHFHHFSDLGVFRLGAIHADNVAPDLAEARFFAEPNRLRVLSVFGRILASYEEEASEEFEIGRNNVIRVVVESVIKEPKVWDQLCKIKVKSKICCKFHSV